jgi:hypothetical protein
VLFYILVIFPYSNDHPSVVKWPAGYFKAPILKMLHAFPHHGPEIKFNGHGRHKKCKITFVIIFIADKYTHQGKSK